jgi:hypothetical protein
LLNRKAEIETTLGENLEWMELPGKKASRLRILKEGTLDDETKWEENFDWFLSMAEKFHRVLPKFIKLEE